MKPLILHPTEMSQWYTLVNEAQATTHITLNESTESYLVFLLMRYAQGPKLIDSIVALDFLECMNKAQHYKVAQLREVGDKSLLFCGLFPGMAIKRRVSLNYFSDMGQAAYLTVSELEQPQAQLYGELSAQFKVLQHILQALRGEYWRETAENGQNIHSALHFTLQ